MMSWRAFLFVVLVFPGGALAAEDQAMPREDVRSIRELENQAFGRPDLAMEAPRGEALLALAELGGAASVSSGNMQASDADALYALLQRYRDELLAMGLDSSELDTEMKILRTRADQLQERLDQLHPKDGLKFGGRLYSAFDDLHVMGPAPVAAANTGNSSVPASKPSGVGVRNQLGIVHAELRLLATRGLLSGYVQMDLVAPWGLNALSSGIGFRRAYIEMRLPVVIQAGNLDTQLTPLTLWRNEDSQPFEPEPFKSRRQRLSDDMDMLPHRWEVRGARLSTDMLLFGAQKLELESITAILGLPGSAIYATPTLGFTAGYTLAERFSTYMEGWRAQLPFGEDLIKISENGLIFWDDTATNPNYAGATPATTFRTMNSSVQSVRAEFKKGMVLGNLEYAISSFVAPSIITTPVAAALTGTALIYDLGVQTDAGHLKGFGRMVSNGFYSAGAQGRTEDMRYQYLGPFLSENSQVGAQGEVGVDTAIKASFESRLNDILIPPGVYSSASAGSPGNTWANLLPYGFWENIDPYGVATPNRNGFGAEADWKFFSGLLEPKASYESFNEISGLNGLKPFSMTRMRAGLAMDFKPSLGWPIRLLAGYTADDDKNGQTAPSGTAYDLSDTLTDAGMEYNLGNNMGLDLGYRNMAVKGLNSSLPPATTLGAFDYSQNGGAFWTILGAGLWWKPMETLRFDTTYSHQSSGSPSNIKVSGLAYDQIFVRLTLEL
jgi:hypothetical protein